MKKVFAFIVMIAASAGLRANIFKKMEHITKKAVHGAQKTWTPDNVKETYKQEGQVIQSGWDASQEAAKKAAGTMRVPAAGLGGGVIKGWDASQEAAGKAGHKFTNEEIGGLKKELGL